ncbi:hypothetical protein ACU4GG_29130 [Streptomyces nojiriensis]
MASLVWWITRRDDGPDRRIEEAFEGAATEDEGIEAALAIAKRTARMRKPLPGGVGAPNAAQRQFMDAYAKMLLGKVLGPAIVGSDHQMAMFDVAAAYTQQRKDYLPYSPDELRLMGRAMAVTFDLHGAADALPLPLKRRREADLALVQNITAPALLWTRNALALLDRAANILEVGADVVPDDPAVTLVETIDESDEDAHVSASYALSPIAKPQWLRREQSDWWASALYRMLNGCHDNGLPGGQADLQAAIRALEPVMLALPELVERIYHSWPADQLDTRDSRSTLDPEIAELNMLIQSTYRADPLSHRS